jgi:HEAT repeat protein
MTEDPQLTRHVADLKDGESSVRGAAAEALGKTADVCVMEALLAAAVNDTDANVRSNSIEALQHIDEACAVKLLIGVLREANWFRRWYATEALVRIGRTAVPPLVNALEDRDSNVRRHAARALGKIGEARAVRPLTAALSDGHEEVRREAAQALREIGNVVAVASFIETLHAREAHVRRFAVDSLMQTFRDQESNVRRHAADAVADGASGVEALIAALRDSASTVRCGAAQVLGVIRDSRAVEALVQAINDPDPDVREAAVRSLIGARDRRSVEPLIAALHDDNSEVRLHAAEGLGYIGDSRALEPLIAALRDEHEIVRREAAEALGLIRDVQAVQPLIAALADLHPEVRKAAARSLMRIHDPHAVQRLIVALPNDNPKVRAHAANVLGVLGDTRALESLVTATRDENPAVRDSAACALVAIGDARTIGSLIPALRDQDTHIRTLAAEVITRIEALLQHGGSRRFQVDRDARQMINRIEGDPWAADFEVALASHSILEGPREAARLKNAQFSVCHPWQVKPELWYTLLVYAHDASSRAEVEADSIERLKAEAPYARRSQAAKTEISEGAEILVVPEMPGCRFNPPSARVVWLEKWHRIEFRMQAVSTIAGFELDKAVNGRIAVYVESLLVGEVNIWTLVSNEAGPMAAELLTDVGTATADAYQAIFASYSHEDTTIVETLAKAYSVLGMSFLRDAEALRSGEKWQPRLLELIERADIFQLYWSTAAKRSRYVEQEWRHALAKTKDRLGFIRPVYWQTPMPEPPPELADTHFSYYPVGG